jgi:hypothetical protein
MVLDLAVGEHVKQLRRAGPRPNEHLVRNILRAGTVALGPLLYLALETELLHEDEPECYAPMHALRLLGELGSTDIIEPLLGAFPIEQVYPDERLPLMWFDEAAQMIGRLGEAAVEPLWAIIDDPDWETTSRGVACMALAYAAVAAPETHDAVVAGLLDRMSRSEDRSLTAHLISALSSLGVESAYKDVMGLFREGKVDSEIIVPGTARQLLLTPNVIQRLNCVTHPLWERYDRHALQPAE